jgi:hypothetical protein
MHELGRIEATSRACCSRSPSRPRRAGRSRQASVTTRPSLTVQRQFRLRTQIAKLDRAVLDLLACNEPALGPRLGSVLGWLVGKHTGGSRRQTRRLRMCRVPTSRSARRSRFLWLRRAGHPSARTPFLRGAVALRHQAPAREPAKERTEHEPGLRCKRDIGGQTDDNAERQAQHGSKPDGGSDTHVRECMVAARQVAVGVLSIPERGRVAQWRTRWSTSGLLPPPRASPQQYGSLDVAPRPSGTAQAHGPTGNPPSPRSTPCSEPIRRRARPWRREGRPRPWRAGAPPRPRGAQDQRAALLLPARWPGSGLPRSRAAP